MQIEDFMEVHINIFHAFIAKFFVPPPLRNAQAACSQVHVYSFCFDDGRNSRKLLELYYNTLHCFTNLTTWISKLKKQDIFILLISVHDRFVYWADVLLKFFRSFPLAVAITTVSWINSYKKSCLLPWVHFLFLSDLCLASFDVPFCLPYRSLTTRNRVLCSGKYPYKTIIKTISKVDKILSSTIVCNLYIL